MEKNEAHFLHLINKDDEDGLIHKKISGFVTSGASINDVTIICLEMFE